MALPHPVIVIPGITATQLRDEYSVSPEVLWSAVVHKDYERLMLHPDDIRYELREPSRVAKDTVFEIPYAELIDELRYNLRSREDEPVPVYPFAYDWRQPLERTESALEVFIDEVIARTKLLRHYHRANYGDDPRVNLVGHSMGGLIIAGYLQRTQKASRIWKVASIGSPFRGALEAPIKIATGTAALGEASSSSRDREAARLTPALYYLVPRFEKALVDANDGSELDLFNVATWQRGVIETLGEFIRMHGLSPAKSRAERENIASQLLGDMLGHAMRHRNRIEEFRLIDAGMDSNQWLAIVGVNAKTHVQLHVTRGKDGFGRFQLDPSRDRVDEWTNEDPELRVRTGDGTVPYLGARPGFLQSENLVCVAPSDFGYWEVADRGLLHMAGFHGILPKLNLVHRLIVSHFSGESRKGTWGRRAPDCGDTTWSPPIEGLEEKR